ncbi:hypothetical protein H6P81_010709 [Aristolochia fimbriata]|uniref:RING-type E3 ubiquitin transferase n=1 Tax=Aristolochia fimbriata TaxID=158543 RepID=A0AAV7EQP3_ARIFI|nr:hypothetical protein H6P81_010709 [Aristolochia fimbriata]
MAILNHIKYCSVACVLLHGLGLLLLIIPLSTSQPAPESSPPPDSASTWQISLTPGDDFILFAIVVFLAVYYFVSNFIQRYPVGDDGRPLFFGRAWAATSRMWIPHSPGPGPAHPTGLDPFLVRAFPTFHYSDLKSSTGGECAVCLSEFRAEERVRLLPGCNHVFHFGCIDAWLTEHTTCPVCRSDLLRREPSSAAADDDNEVAIAVNEDGGGSGPSRGTVATPRQTPEARRGRGFLRVFWRSNSTGHSTTTTTTVQSSEENSERFTLRLQEEIIMREMNGCSAGAGTVPPAEGSASDGSVHPGGDGFKSIP